MKKNISSCTQLLYNIKKVSSIYFSLPYENKLHKRKEKKKPRGKKILIWRKEKNKKISNFFKSIFQTQK
jgi:hypothetical protein